MSENVRGDARSRNFRFPCEQHVYNKTVGKLLPAILGEAFTELGFLPNVKPVEANGVDIVVSLEDDLVLAVEVLNWSIGTRLENRRRGRIIRNLNAFSCSKLLVYTIPLPNIDRVAEYGIDVLEIGYQTIPEAYYNFYLSRNQVVRRKIDNVSTRNEIRTKVLQYLENSGISMPTARSS